MLDEQFIAMSKQTLIQELSSLEEDIQLLKKTLKNEVDVDIEEGDPEIIEREKSVTLMEALESRMAAIDHALKSIEAGQYGICERCGQEIPMERLEVKPEATLCVKCQGDVERMMRRGMNLQRSRWHFPVE
jgi:DnaK suppressor protein